MDYFFKNAFNVVFIIMSFLYLRSASQPVNRYPQGMGDFLDERVMKWAVPQSIGRTPEICPEGHQHDQKGVCRFKLQFHPDLTSNA